MEWLYQVNWEATFVISTSLLELFIRGTLVYLVLFTMLRITKKRETGTLGITDLLLIVLIADATQNAMADDYSSVPEGLFLVGTILFWNYALEFLSFYYEPIRRFTQPPPLPLVRDGQMLPRNMRAELITKEELLGQIRLQGIEDLAEVSIAQMEADGRISVVGKQRQEVGQGKSKQRGR